MQRWLMVLCAVACSSKSSRLYSDEEVATLEAEMKAEAGKHVFTVTDGTWALATPTGELKSCIDRAKSGLEPDAPLVGECGPKFLPLIRAAKQSTARQPHDPTEDYVPVIVAFKYAAFYGATRPPAEAIAIDLDAIDVAVELMHGAPLLPSMIAVACIGIVAKQLALTLDKATLDPSIGARLDAAVGKIPPFGETLSAENAYANSEIAKMAGSNAKDGVDPKDTAAATMEAMKRRGARLAKACPTAATAQACFDGLAGAKLPAAKPSDLAKVGGREKIVEILDAVADVDYSKYAAKVAHARELLTFLRSRLGCTTGTVERAIPAWAQGSAGPETLSGTCVN